MPEKKSTERFRNWSFIGYPDSLPPNWRDVLDELHIQWIESPLHDRDYNPGTGELKKPHYHILLIFPNVKNFSQISKITELLNCPIPQEVQSVVGMVRYFAHLDNPDKAQYDFNSIIAHGGADLSEICKPSASQRHAILKDILSYCREKQITEYCDLVDLILSDPDHSDWFDLISESYTIFLSSYFRSKSFKSSHFSSGCCE